MPASNFHGKTLFKSAQRFWRKSYVGDYIGLVTIIIVYFALKTTDEPFHRLFRLDDPRIQFPHAEIERVPLVNLLIYSTVVPLTVLVVWTLIVARDLHKAHVSILGLAVTVFLTTLLTDTFKDVIGRPRPDLIARCKPRPDTPTSVLVSIDVCTETRHHLLHDGWRSFPSGHSSLAFAGLGWLSMFLASQFGIFRPSANLTVVLLALVPLIGAGFIATSRLEDYRHDVADVTVGSLLGLAVALFNWHRYFPNLLSANAKEPFPPPPGIQLNSSGEYRRARDEEDGGLSEDEGLDGGETRPGGRY